MAYNYVGEYSPTNVYYPNDLVIYEGVEYVCIQASVGNLPTDTAYFTPLTAAVPVVEGSNADLLDGFDSSDFVKISGGVLTGLLNGPSSATQEQAGLVELANTNEALAGMDNIRAITPAGVRGAYTQYGLGIAFTLPENTDLNTITSSGFYRLPLVALNMPEGVGYGQMIVSCGSTTAIQILSSYEEGNIYYRQGQGIGIVPVWSEWVKLFNSMNDGEGSGLDADLLDGQDGSYYLSRLNHTGTQSIATVDGLQGALDSKLNQSGSSFIELGRTDGVAFTPFIDFHSGVTTVDYDARIIAEGGNGTKGGGNLVIECSSLTRNDNKVWDAGNDGEGSGLDADMLDGKHSTDFVQKNNPVVVLSATNSPVNNMELAVELTSNTVLTFKAKGSDGVVRSATLTLA